MLESGTASIDAKFSNAVGITQSTITMGQPVGQVESNGTVEVKSGATLNIRGVVEEASARSIEKFHITKALESMGELFERYGGHAAAAGFTATIDNWSAIQERLRDQISGVQAS